MTCDDLTEERGELVTQNPPWVVAALHSSCLWRRNRRLCLFCCGCWTSVNNSSFIKNKKPFSLDSHGLTSKSDINYYVFSSWTLFRSHSIVHVMFVCPSVKRGERHQTAQWCRTAKNITCRWYCDNVRVCLFGFLFWMLPSGRSTLQGRKSINSQQPEQKQSVQRKGNIMGHEKINWEAERSISVTGVNQSEQRRKMLESWNYLYNLPGFISFSTEYIFSFGSDKINYLRTSPLASGNCDGHFSF